MKALTLWRPWPTAIFYLGKDVENREWLPPDQIIGERIAIHAGNKYDKDALDWMLVTFKPGTEGVVKLLTTLKDKDVKGAIIGTAIIDGWCRPVATKSKWATGPFCWKLKNNIILHEPIPCKGARGLWTVPASIAKIISDRVAMAYTCSQCGARLACGVVEEPADVSDPEPFI